MWVQVAPYESEQLLLNKDAEQRWDIMQLAGYQLVGVWYNHSQWHFSSDIQVNGCWFEYDALPASRRSWQHIGNRPRFASRYHMNDLARGKIRPTHFCFVVPAPN